MTWLAGDWIAGILVPAASVLVSAGIAIGLARSERRAADRDRVGAAAARVVRALTALMNAAAQHDRSAMHSANVVFQGTLNEFSVSLDQKDADVPKYIAAVLATALRTRDPDVVGETSSFLVGVLEGWVRGQLPTRGFAAAMPPDADAVWTSAVRLDQWRGVTDPDAPAVLVRRAEREPSARESADQAPADPPGPADPSASVP